MQLPFRGPLVVTDDESLTAYLTRAAAAAGVVPEFVRDTRDALTSWSSAPLVLVGVDQLDPLAELAPLRRAAVHVVGLGDLRDEVFRTALVCGASTVLELPLAERQLADLLSDAVAGESEPGVMVGVVGGSGGVGSTTFAAALAVSCASGSDTMLVDLDPYGGGVDRVIGVEATDGIRWEQLAEAAGRFSARSLRDALPRRGSLSVLCWSADRAASLSAQTVRSALSAGRRGHQVVVIDLPRAPDPIGDEVLARCDHVVLVSSMTVPGLAAAALVARRLPADRTGVVIRGRGGIQDVAVEHLLGLPVWHRMPDQRRLDESVSLGLGPLRAGRGPLAKAARQVSGVLALEAAS
ncbi:secretion/DNA translocation related CpaE-like protein [Marmoricola sp. OAE513]|uniref:septum site-determining protein Ssd n=1 Tax=Marmoricola sp. OAE513 TaxID=2817894 RepID=UPI001AEB9A0B